MRVTRILGLTAFVTALTLMAIGTLRPAVAQTSPVAAAADAAAPLCRYGVNVISNQTFTDHDTTPLRMGWYLNYRATPNTNSPAGAEFVPVIRLSQTGETEFSYTPSGAALQNAIADNPGARWLIGNEPDRAGVNAGQDNVEPHIYAAAYHALYYLIKQADPTARVIAGTIVQPTPLRLRYLDMVLNSYHQTFGEAMPVDGWSIHNFILNEVSCLYSESLPDEEKIPCWGAEIPPGIDEVIGEIVDINDNDDFDRFKERVVRFRQWMKDRGYRETPLYLSEYGILMPPDYGDPPFGPARVNTYMTRTFDYLTTATSATLGYPADGNRLVQKWSWYSATDQHFNGWLFDSGLSAMGQNYATHTAAIAVENDLAPWRLMTDPGTLYYTGAPLTIQLQAVVSNAGNPAAKAGPAVVRFYDGNPTQGGQQIGVDQTVSLAGCGSNTIAAVQWANVGPGLHQVYVVVDATNAIAETNEANNIQSFPVLVGTQRAFTPRIAR